MHLIPKPAGFELRHKRSDRSDLAQDWTPRDALYQASEQMPDDADAVVVSYRVKNADGAYTYRRFSAGPAGSALDVIVTAMGSEMGWV